MTKPVITVVGAVLEDAQRRILLAQRPADKEMPYLWEFPGGKIEKGETPEDALVRELYEEIGIVVSQQDLKPLTFVSATYAHFHIVLLAYECSRWTGVPYPREGQGGIEWVCVRDLSRYPMPEANNIIVSLLEKRNRN